MDDRHTDGQFPDRTSAARQGGGTTLDPSHLLRFPPGAKPKNVMWIT